MCLVIHSGLHDSLLINNFINFNKNLTVKIGIV
jgi:hypothetical protein